MSPRHLRVVAVFVVVVIMNADGLGAPSFAQTLDDLDEAEDIVSELESALDDATAAYQDIWAQIELAELELEVLRSEAIAYEAAAERARLAVNLQVRQAFKQGSAATLEAFLAVEGPQAAAESAGIFAALQARESVRIEDAMASTLRLQQTRELVRDREVHLDDLRVELEGKAAVLQDRLADAETRATQIRSLVARQRRISRGAQQGIYACIFESAFRFRDTWGAPRSGGRSHRGTDVFAPMNHPTYAFTSGVVQRHSNSRLGGLGLYLRGDDGNVYYYAHLNSIEAAGAVGRRVTAGELIARNGSSGNADRGAPHVHFELHPGGGSAINPYPWLAAACF